MEQASRLLITGVPPESVRRGFRRVRSRLGEAASWDGIGRDAQFNSRDGCSTLRARRETASEWGERKKLVGKAGKDLG